MENRSPVDVRVDYFKNGSFVPISYRDNSGKTQYIRSIEKTEFLQTNSDSIIYYCNLYNSKATLEFHDNRWYYINV